MGLKWKVKKLLSPSQLQLSKLKHGMSTKLRKSALNNISVNTLFSSGIHLISHLYAQLKSPNSLTNLMISQRSTAKSSLPLLIPTSLTENGPVKTEREVDSEP